MEKNFFKEENKEIREEIIKRYEIGGYNSLLDYEVFALILSKLVGNKCNIKELSKKLFKKYKTIENLLNADFIEIKEVVKMTKNDYITMQIIGELAKRLYKEKIVNTNLTAITTKNELLSYLRGKIAFGESEQFLVIFLDNRNQIIKEEVLFNGTIDRSAIYPREVIKKIFKYNARSVIFVHNHPAGSLNPSSADIDLTQRMANTFRELDIRLLDHVIITQASYFSFAENGLI